MSEPAGVLVPGGRNLRADPRSASAWPFCVVYGLDITLHGPQSPICEPWVRAVVSGGPLNVDVASVCEL